MCANKEQQHARYSAKLIRAYLTMRCVHVSFKWMLSDIICKQCSCLQLNASMQVLVGKYVMFMKLKISICMWIDLLHCFESLDLLVTEDLSWLSADFNTVWHEIAAEDFLKFNKRKSFIRLVLFSPCCTKFNISSSLMLSLTSVTSWSLYEKHSWPGCSHRYYPMPILNSLQKKLNCDWIIC